MTNSCMEIKAGATAHDDKLFSQLFSAATYAVEKIGDNLWNCSWFDINCDVPKLTDNDEQNLPGA